MIRQHDFSVHRRHMIILGLTVRDLVEFLHCRYDPLQIPETHIFLLPPVPADKLFQPSPGRGIRKRIGHVFDFSESASDLRSLPAQKRTKDDAQHPHNERYSSNMFSHHFCFDYLVRFDGKSRRDILLYWHSYSYGTEIKSVQKRGHGSSSR